MICENFLFGRMYCSPLWVKLAWMILSLIVLICFWKLDVFLKYINKKFDKKEVKK